jgi:hypothetical protein
MIFCLESQAAPESKGEALGWERRRLSPARQRRVNLLYSVFFLLDRETRVIRAQ